MTITALLFATYADALGTARVSLALSPGATVRDAVEQLRAMPGGAALPEAPAVALNLAYTKGDAALSHGDELALIPPVAGG